MAKDKDSKDTAAETPELIAETAAEVAAETTTTTEEPTVETAQDLAPGDQVKHLNGATYTVRHITQEGVALEGVANLVHPTAITKL